MADLTPDERAALEADLRKVWEYDANEFIHVTREDIALWRAGRAYQAEMSDRKALIARLRKKAKAAIAVAEDLMAGDKI